MKNLTPFISSLFPPQVPQSLYTDLLTSISPPLHPYITFPHFFLPRLPLLSLSLSSGGVIECVIAWLRCVSLRLNPPSVLWASVWDCRHTHSTNIQTLTVKPSSFTPQDDDSCITHLLTWAVRGAVTNITHYDISHKPRW